MVKFLYSTICAKMTLGQTLPLPKACFVVVSHAMITCREMGVSLKPIHSVGYHDRSSVLDLIAGKLLTAWGK